MVFLFCSWCCAQEKNIAIYAAEKIRIDDLRDVKVTGNKMKIAIYGKGGIGKSTISANLSAALAGCGKRVLQIGCDPKHDSTRLLLGGKNIVTALDYMKTTPVAMQRLDRVLHEGYRGVICAEAGGPEPGVGCAGRGILSTFALFERLGLDMNHFDVILYDVLGDVVCGGFAVPLRRGFADMVYVVTSEEFMSIYAANNILKGVKNFDEDGNRLAGLVLNSRGADEDRVPVERFSKKVHLPVKFTVPRSDLFRKAEMLEKTVVEAFPDSAEARVFYEFARDVLKNKRFYPALFLKESTLEKCIFTDAGGAAEKDNGSGGGDCSYPDKPEAGVPRKQKPENIIEAGEKDSIKVSKPILSGASAVFLSKSMLSREPLHGCAFSGALSTTIQIADAITVAHGPRSCTNIACQAVLSSGFRLFSRKKILSANQLMPGVISSDMDESVVIYGGRDNLVKTLEKAAKQTPGAIFLITTCPAGVIGDDPDAAVNQIREQYPELPLIPVTSDGNLRGDYMQGVINACMEGAAGLIDRSVVPETDRVNILAEKNIAFNAETNFDTISDILGLMGIEVNCRFVRNTSVPMLKHFLRAPLNLPAYTDYFGRVMSDFILEKLGVPTFSLPFPVGFTESALWVKALAAFFHKEVVGAEIIEQYQRHYKGMIEKYRSVLKGRKLMIITYMHNVDWIMETAFDLGMIVSKVCILNFSQDNAFITRYPERFEVETDYPPSKRDEDINRLGPDILLGNYTPKNLPYPLHVDMIPMCPDVGFYGGLTFARRWATLIKSPVTEGWKRDAH